MTDQQIFDWLGREEVWYSFGTEAGKYQCFCKTAVESAARMHGTEVYRYYGATYRGYPLEATDDLLAACRRAEWVPKMHAADIGQAQENKTWARVAEIVQAAE